VSRTVPGAFGRLRRRASPAWVIALVAHSIVAAGCGAAAGKPTFALSIRNSGDAPIRLKVIVASAGPPAQDLLVPARSGILQTASKPMDVKDGKADPVVVEVYTDTCAMLTSVKVGEGRTRIVIAADLSVTTSADSGSSSGGVEPELVTACAPGS